MSFRTRLPVLIGSAALLIAIIAAWQRQIHPAWSEYQDEPHVRLITPSLTGEPELCLTCHYGIEEISDSHPVDVFGCVSCHGGDRLSLDKEVAHASMIGTEANPGNPSDLSVVQLGCGTADCHEGEAGEERDHIARVMRSVQATYAGPINALLDSQGLRPDGAHYGTLDVRDDTIEDTVSVPWLTRFVPEQFDNPAVETFTEGCLSCHVATDARGEATSIGVQAAPPATCCTPMTVIIRARTRRSQPMSLVIPSHIR